MGFVQRDSFQHRPMTSVSGLSGLRPGDAGKNLKRWWSDMTKKEHEEAIIKAFIVHGKCNRYIELLAKPKRRKKILDDLNHCRDINPKYSTEVHSHSDIFQLLKSKGAPETCYVISDVPELDGREMPLSDALDEVEIGIWGTLIGCVPGRLGYYYGESGERRSILERKS